MLNLTLTSADGYSVSLAAAGRGFTPANGYQLLSLGNGPDLRAACGSVLYRSGGPAGHHHWP